MAKGIYVASAEGHTAKSVVALGLINSLTTKYSKINIFRAITKSTTGNDPILNLLREAAGSAVPTEDCFGASYDEIHASPDKAMTLVLERFKKVEEQSDFVLVIGSDYTDIFSPAEFQFNARVAANLQTPLVLVFNGRELFESSESIGQAGARSTQDIASMAEVISQEIEKADAELLAAVVNRADPEFVSSIRQAIGSVIGDDLPVWVIPEDKSLLAPRVSQIAEAVGGKLRFGAEAEMQTEVQDLVVAAMTPEHVLERISEDAIVVVPSDRTDVLLSLLMAEDSSTFPELAGIVLIGGFPIPHQIEQLIEGMNPTLPVIEASGNTFDTTLKISATRGVISVTDPEKAARASRLASENIDFASLIGLIDDFQSSVVTPLLFQHRIFERARNNKKKIVLPEGSDDRILLAAAKVLEQQIADLIILGDPSFLKSRAEALGISLDGAQLMPIQESEHFEACVAEYVKLRSHKGVTEASARETMLDVSYFGTMLVQLGIADGMVSGAAYTTAHTIKPAFEFVKTKPGVSVVSSVFLMALSDRVLVYGDCAVIPEPTADQLADIAISSAETAENFGIDPKIALLSYSTGTSGSGVEVDKVREATELVRRRAPELVVEGPIQYDAAVDAAVAKAKLPGSEVGGKATVFVFPDLNTGNNTYKAVQRTAGAVAIGPILQGLKKPVNDLSRGARVEDIVNTIAITAIQAGQK